MGTPEPGSTDVHRTEIETRARLEAASAEGDEQRLSTLQDLYRDLENELEGDLGQAGTSRH